jgi:hypothetical protein
LAVSTDRAAPPQPIGDDVWLYRRINAEPPWIERDPESGRWRPHHTSFQNSSWPGEELNMSIYLDDTLRDLGLTPDDVIAPPEAPFLVRLRAGTVRSLHEGHQDFPPQTVVRSVPEERTSRLDEAHGDVVGEKKRRGVRKAIAAVAEWVVEPPAELPGL